MFFYLDNSYICLKFQNLHKMSIVDEILKKANKLQEEEYLFTETPELSQIDDLTNPTPAVVSHATVFVVNLKNLPFIVRNYGKRVASKAQKTFHAILSIFARETNSYLVDYTSKSFLLIYPDSIEEIDSHIENAFKLSYLLGKVLVKSVAQFANLTFGIGIDHGRVLGSRCDNKTLWYGYCIDKAEAISETTMKPCYLGISKLVYSKLSGTLKTKTHHILGIPKKEAIWFKTEYKFENESKHCYTSNYTIETE